VCGSSRSGTTLVARILDRHPQVHALAELHVFEDLWRPGDAHRRLDTAAAEAFAVELLVRQRQLAMTFEARRERVAGEAVELVAGLPPGPTRSQVLQAFLDAEAARAGKRIGLDHTPRTVFSLGEALHALPGARAVVTVRDPRDVVASQKHKADSLFRGEPFPRHEARRLRAGYHPLTTALLWRGATLASLAARDDPRVLLIPFEQLLDDPGAWLQRLLDFLGLEPAEGLLSVDRLGSSYRTDPEQPVTHGLDRAAIGAWRGSLSETEAWICQTAVAGTMRSAGYEPARVRPSPLGLAAQALLLPPKTVLAAALNHRRYSHPLRAALRRIRP
jgi:omega-hydroxy-beta-dihydromenaquinone-9 sulfotransferase